MFSNQRICDSQIGSTQTIHLLQPDDSSSSSTLLVFFKQMILFPSGWLLSATSWFMIPNNYTRGFVNHTNSNQLICSEKFWPDIRQSRHEVSWFCHNIINVSTFVFWSYPIVVANPKCQGWVEPPHPWEPALTFQTSGLSSSMPCSA